MWSILQQAQIECPLIPRGNHFQDKQFKRRTTEQRQSLSHNNTIHDASKENSFSTRLLTIASQNAYAETMSHIQVPDTETNPGTFVVVLEFRTDAALSRDLTHDADQDPRKLPIQHLRLKRRTR